MALCGVCSETWLKGYCVIGGFAAMVIAGHPYIIGNQVPYISSYLIEGGKLSPEVTWFTEAIFACSAVTMLMGMLLGAFLDRRLGSHWTALLAGFVMASGAMLTYWALDVSAVLTAFTFGVITGFGCGMLFGCPYSALNKHKFENLGLLYGIVNAGFGGGAFIFNYIMSGYINPTNHSPDAGSSYNRHFSQPAVLDRIPTSFMLLCACYLFLLPIVVSSMIPPATPESSQPLLTAEKSGPVDQGTEAADVTKTCPDGSYQSTATQNGPRDEGRTEPSNQTSEDRLADQLTPRRLFRYRTFYCVWISLFLGGLSNNAVLALYKELGKSHEPSDFFLTSIGTFGSLASAVARPLWGLFIDKTCYKTTSLVFMGVMSVFLALWRETLLAHRWFYFVWTVAMFAVVAAWPLLVVVACKCYFGTKHYVGNLAVLWASVCAGSVALPLLTAPLTGCCGWTGVSLTLAVLVFGGMLVSLLLQREMVLVNSTRPSEDGSPPYTHLSGDSGKETSVSLNHFKSSG